MAKQDFYELSGVARIAPAPTTSRRPIASSRCSIIPDRNPGDKSAEQKFKDISEAYDVLKDEQKRAAYDRFGHAAFEKGGGRGPGDFGFAAGFADIFDEMFGEFMGGGRRGQQGPQPRQRPALQSRDHARGRFQGQADDDPRPEPRACEQCNGSGAEAGLKAGRLPDLPRPRPGSRAAGLLHHRAHLPRLPRRGPRHRESVPELRRPRPRAARRRRCPSTSRRGSRTASRIRLAGEGEAGVRGGAPGDLYIFLAVKPHRHLPARRRQHPLPRADLDADRGARAARSRCR